MGFRDSLRFEGSEGSVMGGPIVTLGWIVVMANGGCNDIRAVLRY